MIFYWLFSFVFGPSVENARSITRASQTSIANLRSRMVKKKRNKGEQTHFYPRERELRMEKEKKQITSGAGQLLQCSVCFLSMTL
jgi:hypothetical protein